MNDRNITLCVNKQNIMITCLPSGCCHGVTELNLTDNLRLLQNNIIQRTILFNNDLTTWAILANDKVYCLCSCFITPCLTTITNSSNQQVHSWQQLISPTSSMTTGTRRQVHISPSKWKWVSAVEMGDNGAPENISWAAEDASAKTCTFSCWY